MNAETLICALADDPLERLRWLVLRYFRVLPGSAAANEVSDENVVVSGAHMVIDARESRAGGENAYNCGFDADKFNELSEDET